MTSQDPFDPSKFRPYRPGRGAEGDREGLPPAEPSGIQEPGSEPEGIGVGPRTGRRRGADPVAGGGGAMELVGRGPVRPDDIVVRGDEAILGILAVWAIAVIAANSRGLLGRVFGPAEIPFWVGYVLALAEDVLILALLFYLLTIKHGEGLVDGLHLRAGPWRWTVGAAAFGVVTCVGVILLLKVLDVKAYGTFELGLGDPVEKVLVTVTVLATAFAHELYYRGLIFPLLRRGVGTPLAVIAVTVWFGLAHFSRVEAHAHLVVIMGFLGLATTLVRHFSKSLGPAVAMNLAYSVSLCLFLWLHPLWGG